MERKIGEIFEYNGEWYQCVEGKTICSECDLRNIICQRDTNINNPFKGCSGNYRTDKRTVIFKKLEKVGEPYSDYCHPSGGVIYFQRYKCYQKPVYTGNMIYWADDINISIEIKQNKEDMEDNKLNLKPFDIQKAREGKPVCTRDGRKARIICTDTKGDPCPIIALVEENGLESAYHYDKNGQNAYNKSKLDLMMLPEKKEGWVNIDKGGSGKITVSSPYSTKEEAIHNDNECTIDTIKINWSE